LITFLSKVKYTISNVNIFMLYKISQVTITVKVKVITVKIQIKQSRYRPGVAQRGFQEVKAPRFHDNGTGWW